MNTGAHRRLADARGAPTPGVMTSSIGSARHAPIPRSKVRLDSVFFVTIIFCPLSAFRIWKGMLFTISSTTLEKRYWPAITPAAIFLTAGRSVRLRGPRPSA